MENVFTVFPGSVQLCHPHSPVTVHDGVEPVSNGDSRAVGELLLDGHLDQVISLYIHRSSGLIHDQNLGFPKQGPGQAQQLPLPYAVASGTNQALAPQDQGVTWDGCVRVHARALFMFQIRLSEPLLLNSSRMNT